MRGTSSVGPESRAHRRSRLARIPIVRLVVVAALIVLLGFLTVAVALQANRLTPLQWLVAIGFLAPIAAAIIAILWYGRGLGRATLGRTEAEEAARASEGGFRTVASVMADGIVTIDKESAIQFVNDAALKIFGYSQEELIGRPLTLLMPDRYRERHLRSLGRYLETGERQVAWEGIEFTGLHKSGREIPLEISLGEYSGSGGRRLLTGIVRDVTERHRAAEALARSEAKFRGLYESTVDSIFFVDRAGTIVDINPAAQELLEAPRSDLIGKHIQEFLRSESLLLGGPHLDAFLSESLGTQGHEGVLTTSNGRDRVVQLSAVVLRPEGSDPQVVVIARDVTDEAELQRKLLESERWASMGRLASYVAHEINTPLTNISLLRASIARRVSDLEVLTRLDKIGVQSRIAASITAELLKFAKPGTINVVEADLREIVRAAVEHADVYREKGTSLRVDAGNRPSPCRVDPVRMQEVFVNLLKNAYEATPNGEVAVRLEDRRDFLAVSVADSGVGMPAEVLARLFEPFFTTKKKGEGTGLGLALSKSFVVAHGGDISISSEVGRGSTFTVSIPRRVEADPGAVRPTAT